MSSFDDDELRRDPAESTLVLTDVRDADGTRWRAVSLAPDGSLAIRGHDLGPGVERVLGCHEYEFERRLSAADVAALRALLAVPEDGDLLRAIGGCFARAGELESFVQDQGIPGKFWSRLGN